MSPNILFSIMGSNKPIDKAIVQKMFEMRAACDNASKIGSFFHRERIILMTHPPKSPDLNPIENVWGYLKNIVQARVPKTLDELDQFVQEDFKEIITSSYCQKLYDSMPKRLDLVIKSKGFRIKY